MLFAEVWGLPVAQARKGRFGAIASLYGQDTSRVAGRPGSVADSPAARATCRALWQIRQRRGRGAARLFGGLARHGGEVLPGSLAEQAVSVT